MMPSMKQNFMFYLLCLTALAIAHVCAAQRYYAPLPLGQSAYDPQLKLPVAVQYYLPAWSIGSAKRVHSWTFLSDVPDSVCTIRHQDYTRTGYDRGHMLPAADRSFDLGVMRATFVMSNVAPQTPALNRGPWAKAEEEVRRMARELGEVKVFNAPIFFMTDTAFLYPAQVAIPHAFLKIAMNVQCDTIYRYWVFLNK